MGFVLLLFNLKSHLARNVTIFSAFVTLFQAAGLALRVRGNNGIVAREVYDWLPAIGLQYHLAVDGISAVFLLLVAFVFLMGTFASPVSSGARYFGLLLLLQSGLLGTFMAQNFLHFFLFWELALIPAFFLVRLYGGPNSARAAVPVLSLHNGRQHRDAHWLSRSLPCDRHFQPRGTRQFPACGRFRAIARPTTPMARREFPGRSAPLFSSSSFWASQ